MKYSELVKKEKEQLLEVKSSGANPKDKCEEMSGDQAEFCKGLVKNLPESDVCRIINCCFATSIRVCGSSSSWTISTTEVYAKDMVMGGQKKNFIVKADGNLGEFCSSCTYDETRNYIAPTSECSDKGPKVPRNNRFVQCIGEVPTPALGVGYSDDKRMVAANKCFNGYVEYEGAIETSISLASRESFKEIEKSLNAGIDVGGSFGLFSASSSAKYSRAIKDNHYSRSFHFSQEIKLPTAHYRLNKRGVDALNEYGKSAYKDGPQHFRDECGNRLINEVHQAIILYVTFKIQFFSRTAKETFEAKLEAKYGDIASLKAEVSSTSSKNSIDGQVYFFAYQAGGDANKLAQIFEKSDQGYHVTSCSLKNLNDCNKVIDGVIKYSAENLSKQVNKESGTVIKGDAIPLSFTMTSIKGLDVGESVISDAIWDAREVLWDKLVEQMEVSDLVKHAIDFPNAHHFPTETTLAKLNTVYDVLQSNKEMLESAIYSCYEEPTECVEKQQDIVGRLTEVTLLEG